MAGHSRYSVSVEGAGLRNGILKNKLGIKDQKALDDAETLLLSDTYTRYFEKLAKGDLRFSLSLLFEIHCYFLGPLYTWAGKIRSVDISKEGVLFASSEFLEKSLKNFGQALLRSLPTSSDPKGQVAEKLAFIHNELNALHPFREGNGRTTRLFLDLLAVQAGYEPIDWSRTSRTKYFEACRVGMVKDHSMMKGIMFRSLKKSKKGV